LIDDDPDNLHQVRLSLQAEGHTVRVTANGDDLDSALERDAFDICVLGVSAENDDALSLLPQLRRISPAMRVLVMTGRPDSSLTVAALRAGASDFLPRPCKTKELLHAVGQQLSELGRQWTPPDITAAEPTTSEPAFRSTLQFARRVARTDATVLILGENGTGKTQLARCLHGWSPRAARCFVTVSCPSLTSELLASELFGHVRGAFTGAIDHRPGRVEVAEGGTLFLDEVGDLPMALQSKLLRFLQDREYERLGDPQTRSADVRVVAATNQDLSAMVRDGRFREDLYYRLNVVCLELPALRARPHDLLPLARGMLLEEAQRYGRPSLEFSPEALAILVAHDWPGNLRELHNTIERAVILADDVTVRAEHLLLTPSSRAAAAAEATSGRAGAGDPISLQELERAHIEAIIARSESLETAARRLGIDSSTLYRKRRRYGQCLSD